MRQPTRLKDIADATGYSANTVSLALRDSPRISAETRSIIQAAAQRLDYLPNLVAQALVSRQTKTIGLVLTDITNPVLTQVARSIERDLAARGYSLMLAATDNVPEKELRALEVFRARQVDGILIFPTNHGELAHIRALRHDGHPVLVLTMIPSADIDLVAIDDRTGALKAVRHLLERGHLRIAILDAALALGNREKFDGARAAVLQAGLPETTLIQIRPGGHAAIDGYRSMQTALAMNPRPTAIFATNDSLALGAIKQCRDNDLNIPKDVAIVGYDNTEVAEYSPVPMTSVDYAAEELSQHAVMRILAMTGALPTVHTSKTKLIEPNLVIRRST
ncbi:MAG: LacI family DNA-binding transcriptional regulator [Pseudomonadota bacterium]